MSLNDIIVLPAAFQECFEHTNSLPVPPTALARAHQRIQSYHSIFWTSRLVVIPLQRGRHWFLGLITNTCLARAQHTVQAPPQAPEEGDTHPDERPFGIMILNSWATSSDVEFMVQCLKAYLSYSWNMRDDGKLQYVYSHYARVCALSKNVYVGYLLIIM